MIYIELLGRILFPSHAYLFPQDMTVRDGDLDLLLRSIAMSQEPEAEMSMRERESERIGHGGSVHPPPISIDMFLARIPVWHHRNRRPISFQIP